MHLLAAEYGAVEQVRPTVDLDIVVNVRVRPRGTEWLGKWLGDRTFVLEGANPDGIGHRFARPATDESGHTFVDILAPDGLGARTRTYTHHPFRTVLAPVGTQALDRSELVEVAVSGMPDRGTKTGRVRRPTLLGALVVKAAATTIAGREIPERDWQDAALLLTMIPDPMAAADECGRTDRRRLQPLNELRQRDHPEWATLDGDAYQRGSTALEFLLGS